MRLPGSILFVSALFMLATSCKKNDNTIPSPGVDHRGGSDTLRLGATVTYRPAMAHPSGATFSWKVNGQVVGNDSLFTFNAVSRGDYHIVFTATNSAAADSAIYQVKVWGKYENGFLVVQEGQYGTTTGDLFYYSYDSNKVVYNVFKTENPDRDFGSATATLQFATIHNGRVYMTAKVGGPLVVANAYTMKETGRIDHLPQDEGHAFLGIDNARGLLSTVDGVYRLNLAGPALGAKIDGINSNAGDMMVAGDYVFVLTADDGIVVLKTTDYSIVKKFPKATMGFARTKDGAVWAAGDSALMRIDPANLTITETHIPFKVTNPWALWAWHSGGIVAGTSGNEVYLAERKEGPGIGGTLEYSGTRIYKYTPGNSSAFAAPFITIPDGQYFYGSAVRLNERTKELVVLTLTDEWGSSNDNRWLFYDASSGALKQTLRYPGYYFPTLPVFYQ